ncbi:hypothetical protein B1K54_27890 [Streptomyces sp. fd1-xmd]|uniref:Membrane protein YmcC n=2 Tax=Streptomyces TaxID=1883 RepID=A0ABX3FV32_9ACTN|nr:hypothetical protein B1K54_27890 [Streptomyces sp. fd1-xmd]OLZ57480.1 hypothetical protein AVW11_29405 [Streptomyces amritsarensis]
MLYLIILCDILFWVLLAAGLAARYVKGWKRLGGGILLCVPLLDVVLLGATVISLKGGAEVGIWHGLSAAYLGFTVAFGHDTLRWADEKFGRRFGGVPETPREVLYGRDRVMREWRSWLRFLLAYTVSCALLIGMTWFVGGVERGALLLAWLNPLTKILIYSLVWPVIVTIRPGREPEETAPRTTAE